MEYQPRFLYPTSRQYPFDALCDHIVRALEKKQWTVPGITVEFATYGSGERKYRHVLHIDGRDFHLYFSRIQGKLDGQWNDVAAIHQLLIPGKQLSVHEDYSGPTLYEYTGTNWEVDREAFKEEMRHYHTNLLSVRIPKEKQDKAVLFKEFEAWLTQNVLDVITASADSQQTMQVEERVSPVAYPSHLGAFYIRVNGVEELRITLGKTNPMDLVPEDRYALRGSGGGRGWRLVPLGVRDDRTLPDAAYRGYTYGRLCGPNDTELQDGNGRWVRIRPKTATHLFLYDESPGDAYKKAVWEQGRSTFNDEELDEWKRCRGRTVVPIHQYDGSYAKPVMMMGTEKELTFDEVEFV